jgi:hypothetical protein
MSGLQPIGQENDASTCRGGHRTMAKAAGYFGDNEVFVFLAELYYLWF